MRDRLTAIRDGISIRADMQVYAGLGFCQSPSPPIDK
jgi:hypothetical protein